MDRTGPMTTKGCVILDANGNPVGSTSRPEMSEAFAAAYNAMTREKLFDKCAIAQELAHRDMKIERLRAALASVVKQIDQHDEHYSDPRCYYQCGWDWDLLSAEAVLAEPQPIPARDQEHDGHDGHL